MIRVSVDVRNHRLTIAGHARSAPKGEDLVCAAVSALGWTLLRAVLERAEYRAEYALDEKGGGLEIRCAPSPPYIARCRDMFRLIALGLSLLADKYPEYISYEEGTGP